MGRNGHGPKWVLGEMTRNPARSLLFSHNIGTLLYIHCHENWPTYRLKTSLKMHTKTFFNIFNISS